MPKPDYNRRLTHRDVIRLFRSGKYRLDGCRVISRYTGKPICQCVGGREGERWWVRLYEKPKFIFLPRAVLVWVVTTGTPVPRGFQVHHRDEDPQNDEFYNLICAHRLDHGKLHDKNGTPF